jgi:putative phosphoesterase
MYTAFLKQIKRPDAVIFLGDGLRDLTYCRFGDVPVLSVKGNCDTFTVGMDDVDDEIVMTLGGKRIMMVHGDLYSVKSGFARLVMAADEKGADIVLFGHTHEPFSLYLDAEDNGFGLKLKKPLYLFNPGSIGGYHSSFGCIEIRDSGEVMLSHGDL